MLVLSRKLNQSIQIGENISISIVRIKGNVVQLGIEAPREIRVVRSELIQRETSQGGQIGLATTAASATSYCFRPGGMGISLGSAVSSGSGTEIIEPDVALSQS